MINYLTVPDLELQIQLLLDIQDDHNMLQTVGTDTDFTSEYNKENRYDWQDPEDINLSPTKSTASVVTPSKIHRDNSPTKNTTPLVVRHSRKSLS